MSLSDLPELWTESTKIGTLLENKVLKDLEMHVFLGKKKLVQLIIRATFVTEWGDQKTVLLKVFTS